MSELCKERVYSGARWDFRGHTCTKKVWKDGYCKIHHSESVAKRREESDERWKEKRENEPIVKLMKANKRIEELESENNLLKDKLEDVNILLAECNIRRI